MNRPPSMERRSDRTRQQIMSAFTGLVFEGGFENVSVQGLVGAAGVARSTFYEHFSGKEDVLRASMEHLFSVIADCVVEDKMPGDLAAVLDHMWSNRRLAGAIFSGQARAVLARSQADLVEGRLRQAAQGRVPCIPLRLAAIEIAEAQLALIESWLRGRAHCPADRLASGMHRTTRAVAKVVLG